jgi:hypothetical protein
LPRSQVVRMRTVWSNCTTMVSFCSHWRNSYTDACIAINAMEHSYSNLYAPSAAFTSMMATTQDICLHYSHHQNSHSSLALNSVMKPSLPDPTPEFMTGRLHPDKRPVGVSSTCLHVDTACAKLFHHFSLLHMCCDNASRNVFA